VTLPFRLSAASLSCGLLGCGIADDGSSKQPCDSENCAPKTCTLNGITYQEGDTFNDDCNTCSCDDGEVSCTLLLCTEDPGEDPEDICSLPFDPGPCDADIKSYWFNSEQGGCEVVSYGGCGGNENRFSSYQDCFAHCRPTTPGASCEVNGVIYPHGATQVPNLVDCNGCHCENGTLTTCTLIYCPETSCLATEEVGEECAQCGRSEERR